MGAVVERTGLPAVIEEEAFLYGLMAEFEHAEPLVEAARQAREQGYERVEAYTPFPVEGLSDALGHRDKWVPLIMLAGGVLGCAAGFGLIYWCTVSAYPLNVGGRPLFGWPYFVPITFEVTVLVSALSGVVGMLLLNGLPMPYHPVFDAPDFARASSDRFFLCIEASDPRFDRKGTREYLESLGALSVSEVELKK